MSAAKEAPKEAAKEAAAPAGDAAGKPAAKASNPLIPLIAVVVLAPVLSFVIFKFVMLPSFKKELASSPAGEQAEASATATEEAHATAAKEESHGGKEGAHGKKGEGGPANTYEFENVVVNLAGTMGTRYLKTSFMVTGADKSLRSAFENNKPKLVDVTLNVLSSLSLADLEEAGSKNLIREKLIAAYNQALGKRIAEQIYFTDFVVQ